MIYFLAALSSSRSLVGSCDSCDSSISSDVSDSNDSSYSSDRCDSIDSSDCNDKKKMLSHFFLSKNVTNKKVKL